MKVKISGLFLCLLLSSFSAIAQREPSPEEEAFFTKAMSQINPKHVRWIKSTATEANQKSLTTEDIQAKASSYGLLGGMNGQDIEAIVFLVLMQASKSAQEDLKSIMAQVKAINEKKKKLREAEAAMKDQNRSITRVQLDSFSLLLINPPATRRLKSSSDRQPVTLAEKNEFAQKAKSDLVSMNEMGEMESLRLQMVMDRRSKFMSTLSNLMKKISQTQDSIIDNLK